MEFVGCRDCKGLGFTEFEFEGEVVTKKCKCRYRYEQRMKAVYTLKHKNIELDADFGFKQYVGTNTELQGRLVTMSKNFEDFLGKSFYFYGKASTQKTTMAKVLAREVYLKGHDVYYTLMNTLVQNSVALLNFDDDKDKDLRDYKETIANVPLLIIDESFMKERILIYKSGFQIPHLDTFLRDRLETKKDKVTIFISNTAISDIDENVFNPYIKELIRRNCTTLTFTDHVLSESNNVDLIFGKASN